MTPLLDILARFRFTSTVTLYLILSIEKKLEHDFLAVLGKMLHIFLNISDSLDVKRNMGMR